MDYLKFLVGFAILLLGVTFVLYPVDQFLPWFSDLVPLLKDKSIFEYLKDNSSLVYFFIGGSIIFFVTYQALK